MTKFVIYFSLTNRHNSLLPKTKSKKVLLDQVKVHLKLCLINQLHLKTDTLFSTGEIMRETTEMNYKKGELPSNTFEATLSPFKHLHASIYNLFSSLHRHVFWIFQDYISVFIFFQTTFQSVSASGYWTLSNVKMEFRNKKTVLMKADVSVVKF